MKTEFCNKNWYVYKSVGIQVKKQKRFLRIWWASRADEIYLGINRILLRYKYNEPNLIVKSVNGYNNSVKLSSYGANTAYIRNGYAIEWADPNNNPFKIGNIVKVDLPFFHFDNVDILNIYIYGNNLNLTTKDILSQSNIKKIYKQGIDYLKKVGKSGEEFVVSYQIAPKVVEMIYFGGDKNTKKDNNNYKKIFYSDYWIPFFFSWDNKGGTNNYKVLPFASNPNDDIREYTYYDLDFYGLARQGTKWKGSRMVRQE